MVSINLPVFVHRTRACAEWQHMVRSVLQILKNPDPCGIYECNR